MSQPPAHPKIYHILHHDRLASVVAAGCLWPDSYKREQGRPGTTVGMRQIKERRLSLPVDCLANCMVGDCVPFYFCSRSVMLYLLHMGNHPNLDYRGGQAPIVHLESDLHRAVEWAGDNGRRWGFSLSNAGAYGTEFRCELDQLDELDWDAIGARQWARVREAKQAEFLMEKSFPWELVERVGVHSAAVAQRVTAAFGQAHHRPLVQVMQDWYY